MYILIALYNVKYVTYFTIVKIITNKENYTTQNFFKISYNLNSIGTHYLL